MAISDIYRIKTQNSVYEIQITDNDTARCRKESAMEIGPWYSVSTPSWTWRSSASGRRSDSRWR